jgi:hypothetical protein
MLPFAAPARNTDTFISPVGAEQRILISPVSLEFVEKRYQFEDPGEIVSMICVPYASLAYDPGLGIGVVICVNEAVEVLLEVDELVTEFEGVFDAVCVGLGVCEGVPEFEGVFEAVDVNVGLMEIVPVKLEVALRVADALEVRVG